MSKILTVTANPAIDRVYFLKDFHIGQVHRPIKAVYTAGGKGLNVSRVCKTLDQAVLATGFLGGYTGDFIRSEVKKMGIEERFTPIAGETRLCLNLSDQQGISSEILESGPVISPEESEDFFDTFQTAISEADIVTVSGSLPQGLDSHFYITLLDIAKKHHKKVIFDVSGQTLQDIIANKPFLVKPNKEEFLKLTGWDTFVPDKALLFLKNSGVEIPFISLGKDGAVALIEETIYTFIVPAIHAVNTVGSGDSTIAGIATGINRGMSIYDAIRLGMAAGITNALFERTGYVTKELVRDFYEKIQFRTL